LALIVERRGGYRQSTLDVALEVSRNHLGVSGVPEAAGHAALEREDRYEANRKSSNNEWKNRDDYQQLDQGESLIGALNLASHEPEFRTRRTEP
jgi:hypothetical protein